MEGVAISRRRLYASSVVCSLSSMIFGLNLTLLGCVEEVFDRKNTAEKTASVSLTDEQWASVTSIFSIGALLSGIASPYIKLNRKTCIIANNAFYLAGLLFLLFAKGYASVLFSRILVGIGIGFTCAYVPLYLKQISPLDIRGLICGFHQFFIVVGVLLGQILSFCFGMPSIWKVGIASVLIFVFLHTLSLFFIQDVAIYRNSHEKTKSILALLKNKRARLSIVTAIILHSAQQMSCINGVLFYSNKLFRETGNQRFYTIVIGMTFVVSTIISMFLVDKYGRKSLLLLSILVDIVALMILCVVESTLIPILVFVAGFSLGLGPIVWFISGEIFPSEYSSAGAALAMAMNWILTYLVSRYFPILYEKYGRLCFSLYSFCLILSFIYVLGVFQETRGKVATFQRLK